MRPVRILAITLVAMVMLAACAPAPTATPVPPPPTAVPPAPTTAPVVPTVAPTKAPAPATATTAPAAPAATTAPVGPTATTAPAVVNTPTTPAMLTMAKTSLGTVLADGKGRIVYIYTKDTTNPSTSNCYDSCASFWPIVYANGKTQAGDGVQANLIGTTQRKDGTTQVTYNGWPVYYFKNDKNPGDTNGQAVTGNWWVIMADGTAITSAPDPSITITLGPGRDGDQNGTATLTAKGNQTLVVVNIKPGPTGVEQPDHIHVGDCPVPGAVKYPLTNIVDGKSSTTVDVKLSDLLKGGFAINAHQSTQEIGKYIACGVIPQGTIITMGAGRDGSQPGTAVLLNQGAKTEVDVFIKPLAGATQPDHIHVGTCPVPDAVKYPLTNIVDGKSKTVVDVALSDLLKGGFAINAHLSAQDIGKYVSCGNITPG
jgi:predicted lipoprotein with Yx(FWY)xxD motif